MNIDDRIRESLRRLSGKRMPDIKHPTLMASREHAVVTSRAAGLQGILSAVQRDARHRDLRPRRQYPLQVIERRVAGLRAVHEPVAVHDDVHEVGVLEGLGRAREHLVRERPARRPLPPQHLAERPAVPREALAPALALEEVLVPRDALEGRGRGLLPLRRDVGDVVARVADEPGHALRPQGGRHARGEAAPVEAGERRPPDAERVEQRYDVRRQRRLLPVAHRARGQEPRRPEAPRVWHDDARAARREVRDHVVVRVDVVGEAVGEDHGPPVLRAVLVVGDFKEWRLDLLELCHDCSIYLLHQSNRLQLSW